MHAKGRYKFQGPKPENSHKAKLNWKIVREMRASSLPIKHFVEKYGVTRSTVGKIRRGDTWRES
jgi:uncharacterized protein YjcR